MTTKTLLDYERRQAERALHREHRLAEINLGTYQPTAQDKAIEAQSTFAEWLTMPTWAACTNPAQDQRRRRVHDFADVLANIEKPAWKSISDMSKFLAMLPDNVSALDTLADFIADGYPVPLS